MALTLTVQEAKGLKNKPLGSTGWREVTQEHIKQFAQATGDNQWIHLDAERCAKESPFKKPVAHGYLSLSMVAGLLPELLEMKARLAVNYGANKVRFPHPVLVGSKVRLTAEIADVEEVEGGVQLTLKTNLEVEGAPKPALAAEVLYRYFA